jgi:tyrosyl-tRNA synthetase
MRRQRRAPFAPRRAPPRGPCLRPRPRPRPAAPAAAPPGAPPSASVIHVLRERGLIQEVTSDELEALAARTSLSVYCGFDPTADSLHLGNLLGIIVLAWFQR